MAILLPARNAANTIEAALRSLQGQTLSEFRCVAIDDGSTDATADVMRSTVADDPRFEIVRQDPLGIAETLRRAALLCTEPLLARQDADDVSHPDRLARQREFLTAHPEIGLVATGVITQSDREPTPGWKRYERWMDEAHTPREIANALWVESPFAHPTVMMRREAYDAAGGYRSVGFPEDYDLWLRMNRASILLAKLPDRLYRWTDRPDRASRTLPEYAAEQFLKCRAHHLRRHLASRPVLIWGAGRDGKRAARQLLSEGVELGGFLDIDPRKIGRTVRGRPVWSASEWLRQAPRRTPAEDAAVRTTLPRLVDEHPIVLSAVGTEGARELIREQLEQLGWIEGEDFLCIA